MYDDIHPSSALVKRLPDKRMDIESNSIKHLHRDLKVLIDTIGKINMNHREYKVYIIQSGNKPRSPIKIGVTHSLDRRVEALQTGNPYPLKVLAAIVCKNKSDAYSLESFFHRCLRKHRMQGEWFKQGAINFKSIFNSYREKSGIHHDLLPVQKLKCKDSTIRKLMDENKRLRGKNNKLIQDMEEYLDRNIME